MEWLIGRLNIWSLLFRLLEAPHLSLYVNKFTKTKDQVVQIPLENIWEILLSQSLSNQGNHSSLKNSFSVSDKTIFCFLLGYTENFLESLINKLKSQQCQTSDDWKWLADFLLVLLFKHSFISRRQVSTHLHHIHKIYQCWFLYLYFIRKMVFDKWIQVVTHIVINVSN